MRTAKLLLLCAFVAALMGCGTTTGPTTEQNAPRPSHAGSKADGRILFSRNGSPDQKQDGIYELDNAGKPRQLLKETDQDLALQYPRWSPDGKRIAYVRQQDRGIYADLWIVNPDGSNNRQITKFKSAIPHSNNVDAQKNYVGDSSIVAGVSWSSDFITFASDKGFKAMRPWIVENPDTATPGDAKTHVMLSVAGFSIPNDPYLQLHIEDTALSPDGKFMAFTAVWQAQGGPQRVTQIYMLNLTSGKYSQLTELPDGAYDPSFSPDGQYLVFAGRPGFRVNDIYTMTRDGKNITKVTDNGNARSPIFSPDGKKVAFLSAAETNQFAIYTMDAMIDPSGANMPAFGKPEKISDMDWIDARSGLSWSAG